MFLKPLKVGKTLKP